MAVSRINSASSGIVYPTSFSFARPADTNVYAVNDNISNSTSSPTILTFGSAARFSGGSGYITHAILLTDQAANVSAFRLHLYSTTLTAINDNAAMSVLYSNRSTYQGYIDFPAAITNGSDTACSQSVQSPLPYICSGTSLFGQLQTVTGFTPASAQNFFINLFCDQN